MTKLAFDKLLQSLIVGLRADDHTNPRFTFQLRFFLSACVLALAIATLSLPVSILTGPRHSPYLIALFAVLIILQMALVRLGVSLETLAWTLLGTVTVFLISTMIVTRELDPSQLPWMILIPLSARAFTAPQIEDSSVQPTSRVTAIGTLVAIVAVGVVIGCHSFGLTFDQPLASEPMWAVAANFVLFLASSIGLVFIYDLSVQITIAELQRVRSLMSICAWCRKISSDGEWITIESYTARHTQTDLSHGICPTCSESQFQHLSKLQT